MRHTNAQAQFHDFEARLEAKQNKINVIITGIKPVLDFVDPELPEPQVYSFSERPP